MADLDPSWWDLVFSRIDEIHRRRPPLNAILLSALARSSYSVDEALARFDAALAGMATRGYKDGLAVEAAASILASAPIEAGAMVDRFAFVASDRKSTRLNSSHQIISYAVFCLKKKKTTPAD